MQSIVYLPAFRWMRKHLGAKINNPKDVFTSQQLEQSGQGCEQPGAHSQLLEDYIRFHCYGQDITFNDALFATSVQLS